MASTDFTFFGLNPRMSASEAALMWLGLAGFSSASATLVEADFAPALGSFSKGAFVFDVTVLAMARTSSRLKAMGLMAALRFRMLSRRADFFEGFSMVA